MADTKEDYFKKFHGDITWSVSDEEIDSGFFCSGLSRYLDVKFGEKEARRQATKIIKWFRNWPIPLDKHLIEKIMVYFFQIMDSEQSWDYLTENYKKAQSFREPSNQNWQHYRDLKKALESAPTEKEETRLRSLMKTFLEEIDCGWYSSYELLEESSKLLGQIGKTKLTNENKLLLKELVEELGVYCENPRDRSGNEERIANDSEAANKLTVFAAYFGLRLPPDLRKLDVDSVKLKKPILRRVQ